MKKITSKPVYRRCCSALASVPLVLGLSACNSEPPPTQLDKVWPGYVSISRAGSTNTPIIDLEGNVVKSFDCNGFPAKVLPDSSVICNDFVVGGFSVNTLRQVSAQGDELWYFNDWEDGASNQHHDFQVGGTNPVGYYVPDTTMYGPADGANTLILSYSNYEADENTLRYGQLEDSVIYELDANNNVVWQWHGMDHIDEMGFSESALTDIYYGLATMKDWLHMNAMSYLGPNKWYDQGDERFNPGNLIVSSPRGRWLAIIEKSSGDIVWRLGPDYSEGQPLSDLGGLAFQHHGHMIPHGLPGAGNILVLDNGFVSGYGDQTTLSRSFSRVLEINPQDFSIVWEYILEPYAAIMGSAQRLPNGNTFIAAGLSGVMLEVTADKEVVWQMDEAPLYRAYRLPVEWIIPD